MVVPNSHLLGLWSKHQLKTLHVRSPHSRENNQLPLTSVLEPTSKSPSLSAPTNQSANEVELYWPRYMTIPFSHTATGAKKHTRKTFTSRYCIGSIG